VNCKEKDCGARCSFECIVCSQNRDSGEEGVVNCYRKKSPSIIKSILSVFGKKIRVIL